MKVLHNIFCKRKLKKKKIDQINRMTVSFYQYFTIIDPISFRNDIYIIFHKLCVLGRIYVSHEGINAQISIPKFNLHKLKNFLFTYNQNFKSLFLNRSTENKKRSFYLLTVKVRKKIVADGLKKNICLKKKGMYIEDPVEINNLLKDTNTVFVDVRNSYEYEIGRFEKSILIPGKNFRNQIKNLVDFLLPYKKNKIIMYCTGGIRCEKATALVKLNNYKNVYHIKGGILNYVNQARRKKVPINFKGRLFVFDERMSEKISSDIFSSCYNCRILCNKYTNCRNDICHKLFIQCKSCKRKLFNFCSKICMKTRF